MTQLKLNNIVLAQNQTYELKLANLILVMYDFHLDNL